MLRHPLAGHALGFGDLVGGYHPSQFSAATMNQKTSLVQSAQSVPRALMAGM
jgi:hypothetical protein